MSEQKNLLAKLNPAQQEAVQNVDGPSLVIAGAGSGKTRVITHRIAWLLEEREVPPWRIFAATFTNKAAREMKERVMRLCSGADAARLSIATFHSQCATILRREGQALGLSSRFAICDNTDQKALLRACIEQVCGGKKKIAVGTAQNAVSLAKMRMLEGEAAIHFIEKQRGPKYADIYRLYQERLRESDAADFDDLLLLVVNLWKKHPEILETYQDRYTYLLVDEYQDTNAAQFEMVRLLAGERKNICVVGDEDQSIYSWRGAEIRNLLDFEKHFPGARIIRLEQNYRSRGNILDAAHHVICHNSQRLGKKLWSESEKGDPVILIEGGSENDEAQRIAAEIQHLHKGGLPLSEIAIFYRVNSLSRVYEEALRKADIPYRVIGGVRFFDRAEIKDLLAYLQLIASPGNLIALHRIVNTPRRGIGDTALSRLSLYAREIGEPLFTVMQDPEQVAAAGVKGKAAKSAPLFVKQVNGWIQKMQEMSLRKLMETILEETGYRESLGDPEAIDVLSRLENIDDFLGSLDQFAEDNPKADLYDYLESVALRAQDGDEANADSVSLMTVHNAKGLEFDAVFIVAAEKDIFPNARAVREQMHEEEERRLFYVALTRARQRVYISHAMTRRLYGKMEWPSPSRFVREIPLDLKYSLEKTDLPPLKPTQEFFTAEAFPEVIKGGSDSPPPDSTASEPVETGDGFSGQEEDDALPF